MGKGAETQKGEGLSLMTAGVQDPAFSVPQAVTGAW